MDDKWIIGSQGSVIQGSWVRDSYEHQLDSLGLLETSWILFAWFERYRNCDYGYPGMDPRYYVSDQSTATEMIHEIVI